MNKKCVICEQGESTLKFEDGVYFLKCNECKSEYVDCEIVSMNKPTITTRECPKCKHDTMIAFHSTNEKMCANCGHTINWPLTEGQKKVFNDAKRD